MSAGVSVLAFSLAWATFGVGSGWLVNRVPLRCLDHDGWLTRPRPFEDRGRWYDRHLRVRWWKDRLPEAGGWFRGGVAKDRIRSFRTEDLERLTAETRRAEWVHWANVGFGFTFAAWTDPPVAGIMVAFGLATHLPFVIVQRYNRARLLHVLATTPRRTHAADEWVGRRTES
jgi:glycosyl-4,4'-diaponeurosporenoate acyltransferase